MIDTADVQLTVRARVLAIPGLPARWAWEGKPFSPTAGEEYLEEQFPDGPTSQETIGQFGELDYRPLYVVVVHAPVGSGLRARRCADLIKRAFPPGLELPLPNGDTLVVRAAPDAPKAGQLRAAAPGFVALRVDVPMWLRTDNII